MRPVPALFGLGIFGAAAGITGRLSRDGSVGEIIPAALALVGSGAAHVFGVGKDSGAGPCDGQFANSEVLTDDAAYLRAVTVSGWHCSGFYASQITATVDNPEEDRSGLPTARERPLHDMDMTRTRIFLDMVKASHPDPRPDPKM